VMKLDILILDDKNLYFYHPDNIVSLSVRKFTVGNDKAVADERVCAHQVIECTLIKQSLPFINSFLI